MALINFEGDKKDFDFVTELGKYIGEIEKYFTAEMTRKAGRNNPVRTGKYTLNNLGLDGNGVINKELAKSLINLGSFLEKLRFYVTNEAIGLLYAKVESNGKMVMSRIDLIDSSIMQATNDSINVSVDTLKEVQVSLRDRDDRNLILKGISNTWKDLEDLVIGNEESRYIILQDNERTGPRSEILYSVIPDKNIGKKFTQDEKTGEWFPADSNIRYYKKFNNKPFNMGFLFEWYVKYCIDNDTMMPTDRYSTLEYIISRNKMENVAHFRGGDISWDSRTSLSVLEYETYVQTYQVKKDNAHLFSYSQLIRVLRGLYVTLNSAKKNLGTNRKTNKEFLNKITEISTKGAKMVNQDIDQCMKNLVNLIS